MHSERRRRIGTWRLTALPLIVGLLLTSSSRRARAGDVTIEVTSDQHVTVSGRAISLKSVLEDVCFRAGAELLYFDAVDRAFGGEYHDLPLETLIARLLHDDSYLVQSIRDSRSGAIRVSTLRVLGDPAVGSARRAKGGLRSTWQVPPVLLDTAFGASAEQGDQRENALAMIESRIGGDPVQLQGFLSTDSRQIADAIRRYKGVETPLRALQKRSSDPHVVSKIEEIIAALATPPALPRELPEDSPWNH